MTTEHDHEHGHPHKDGAHHHHPHTPHPHDETANHHALETDVEPEPEPIEPIAGAPTPVVVPPDATRVSDFSELSDAINDRVKVLDLDGEFHIQGPRGLLVPSGTKLYISAGADVAPADKEVGIGFNCRQGNNDPNLDILITGYGGLAPIHGFWGFEDVKGRPTGRAIVAGRNSLFQNLDLYDNAENGMGGGSSHGSRFLHSIVRQNGTEETAGHAAAGLKWANCDGVEIGYVLAEDNFGNGLWLDVSVRTALLHHCAAIGNTRKGYHYEISYGPALYEDCYAAENGWPEGRIRSDGGFIVVSSTNVTYRRCSSEHNVGGAGFAAREDSRPPTTANVVVEDSCSTAGGDTIKIERT